MTSPDLQQSVVLSMLGAGFATAFLHAALPTHWLPFVLVGRGQRWSLSQVLGAVTAAGLAHIATTAAAGGLIVAAGLAIIGAVVAEFVSGTGATQGLAWRILEAGNRLRTAELLAALVWLSFMGLALNALIGAVERRARRFWLGRE